MRAFIELDAVLRDPEDRRLDDGCDRRLERFEHVTCAKSWPPPPPLSGICTLGRDHGQRHLLDDRLPDNATASGRRSTPSRLRARTRFVTMTLG